MLFKLLPYTQRPCVSLHTYVWTKGVFSPNMYCTFRWANLPRKKRNQGFILYYKLYCAGDNPNEITKRITVFSLLERLVTSISNLHVPDRCRSESCWITLNNTLTKRLGVMRKLINKPTPTHYHLELTLQSISGSCTSHAYLPGCLTLQKK